MEIVIPSSDFNLLIVLLATVAGMVFGFIWYSLLGEQWMDAAEFSEKKRVSLRSHGGQGGIIQILAAFGSQLILALMFDNMLRWIGAEWDTMLGGLLLGVLTWAGFVMPVMGVNYAFQGRSMWLYIIDGGHWFFVFAILSGIVGWG